MSGSFTYENLKTGEKWEFPTFAALLAFLELKAGKP